MKRSAMPRRAAQPVAAAAVGLAALVGAGPGAAAAATPVANLQVQVLKINGQTLGAGATIPAGTLLQQVTLTTDDPDSGPQGPLGLNSDPTALVLGEAVTLRVNGALVATAVPAMRAAALRTDAGTFTVLVFSAGGNSYALPQYNQPITTVTRTVAPSTLNAGAASSIVTYWNGLLPAGATVRHGSAFSQVTEAGTVTSAAVADYVLYDADAIRGSGDSSGDEVVLKDLKGAPSNGSVGRLNSSVGVEVLATVRFANGAIGVVRAVRYDNYAAYYAISSYLFDGAALAAAGQTVQNVTGVLSTSPLNHGLTWPQLGFVA
jgi:hypothetical protein